MSEYHSTQTSSHKLHRSSAAIPWPSLGPKMKSDLNPKVAPDVQSIEQEPQEYYVAW